MGFTVRRSRQRTVIWNFAFQYFFVGMLFVNSIVMVPVHLHFISASAYGAWLATGNILVWLTAIDFGLFCPWGPMTIMPRLVSTKRSFELGATGAHVDAKHLLENSVINRMVPLAKLDEAAMEFAAEITCKSPTAMMLHKKTFYAAQDMEYGKGMDFGAAAMVQYHHTPEAKEGMTAFLEGRKPNWEIDGYTSDWSVRRSAAR